MRSWARRCRERERERDLIEAGLNEAAAVLKISAAGRGTRVNAASAVSLCAGHAQQLGGESLLPNLMEVKG